MFIFGLSRQGFNSPHLHQIELVALPSLWTPTEFVPVENWHVAIVVFLVRLEVVVEVASAADPL